MKVFLVFSIILCVKSQSNVEDIICPLPGNPDPTSVSKGECDEYTACEFSSDKCHMKQNKDSGYLVASEPLETSTGIQIDLKKANVSNTLFGDDLEFIRIAFIYYEDYHLQIKIHDPNNERYEVPVKRNFPNSTGSDPLYNLTVASTIGEPFYFEIRRKATNSTLFRTEGPLSFEDQFIQITTVLSSSYFYGLGENCRLSLLRNFDQRVTSSIFASGQIPRPGHNDNLYGSHPYYINVEDDSGNTHSVFLENSNAIEYSTFMLGDSPAVTIRTIGGIIDLHLFLGPTPDDVSVQYTQFIGRPFLPPYWSLGFQLSRWGYNTLDHYMEVYNRMKAAEIPWDTQYFDIDYMDGRRDFTYDLVNFANFSEVLSLLHSEDMKVVLIFDPAIAIDFDTYPSAQRGKDNDVFIKYSDPSYIPDDQPDSAGNYLLGNVWPSNSTAFPDFFNPATVQWWSNEFLLFHKTLNFDAVWIDMNEPTNFETNTRLIFPETQRKALQCPENKLEKPPYGTLASFSDSNNTPTLSDKTICMSSYQTNGFVNYSHYDVHSLYGYSEIIATYGALTENLFPEERPFILSRSNFPGSGQYSAHWLGDNKATWDDLKASLVGIMEFNMFGISMVGADICGFRGEPDEELCTRWMQAGAFYSFDRNHNYQLLADQDPAKPGWNITARVSKEVLTLRYKYLPFLYTKMHNAHMYGLMAIRPLFVVFPSDLDSRSVDDEFMWGEELLVAPVVDQGALSRTVYFPNGIWYDLLTGHVEEAQGFIARSVDAPIDKIPVYVRGGSILPYQTPSKTTTESRKNPFGLTIALDDNNIAKGELFWDDGHSAHSMAEAYLGTLIYNEGLLTLTIQYDANVAKDLNLQNIVIYGYPSNPTEITVNGENVDQSSWDYENETKLLLLNTSLSMSQEFSIIFN